MLKQVVAIDLGGTKVAAALVDDQARVSDIIQEPTRRHNTESVIEQLAALITKLAGPVSDKGSVSTVLGVPGLVDFADGFLMETPNLPLLKIPLKKIIREQTGLPVILENDANLATLGESHFGAGKEFSNLVLLTIGTGIGAGIVIRDRLYRGATGAAAEIGHMILDLEGPRGPCGHKGCFETLASGAAIGRRAEQLWGTKKSVIFDLANGQREQITGELVTQAANEGDELALEIFDHIGNIMGIALVSIIRILDPEAIIVGGGAAAAGDLLLGPARRVLAGETLPPHAGQIPIIVAELGQKAPLLGAAALAFREPES